MNEQSERINDEYQEMSRRHDATSAAQSNDRHLYVNDQASPNVSFTTLSDAICQIFSEFDLIRIFVRVAVKLFSCSLVPNRTKSWQRLW